MPDNLGVRVVQANERWNKATLVSSRETFCSSIFGDAFADRLFPWCFGYLYTICFLLLVLSIVLVCVRCFVQLPDLLWPFLFLPFLFAGASVSLFLNRFLLAELIQTFDVWYLFIRSCSAGIAFASGFNDDPWFEIWLYGLFGIAANLVAVADAMRCIYIFSGFCTLLAGIASINLGFVPGFNIIEYETSLTSGYAITYSNLSIFVKAATIMAVFFIKYLYRAVRHPNRFIILAADLESNKYTISELRQECAKIQRNHRPNSLRQDYHNGTSSAALVSKKTKVIGESLRSVAY